MALSELRGILGIRGEPEVTRVRHWPVGLPQSRVGHAERVAPLFELNRRRPGLFITGNYLRGPSLGACVTLADETATKVDGFLRESAPHSRWEAATG